MLVRKIYNNDDITFFPNINGCKAPVCACINEAKTSSKLPLLPDPGMSLQYFHDCNVPAYKWLAFTREVINLLFAC